MQLLKTTAVAVASCPWCTALVSALRKKQCTSLYWDIRPPSQQQYSCSFEGQRNKEFLSLLGLSGPLRSLSLRSFNYLWRRREKILSHTLTWTHTHTDTLASKHRSKNTNMYYTKMTMICPTGHCSRCSNRQIGSFPKSPLECLWSSLIHKRRISVCICTEQEKTRPSPYENQS